MGVTPYNLKNIVACVGLTDCFLDAIIIFCLFVVFESYPGWVLMDFLVVIITIIHRVIQKETTIEKITQ